MTQAKQSVARASHVAVSWNVDASGDWSTAANWSNGAVPNSNDIVTINTASLQTITHSTGNDTVYALTVGNDLFTLSGGSLYILSKASFAKGFTQTGGLFNGGAVTIKGTGTLIGGGATGTTTLSVTGTAALANYTLGGSSVLKNAKAINQTGQITLGDNTGTNATINNGVGAVYAIAGDYGVTQGAASASIVNGGTLSKSAGNGTSAINATVTSTGTISAATGNLQIDGPSSVIGGVLKGAGEISFAGSGGTSLTLGTATLGTLGLSGTSLLTLGGSASVLNGSLLDVSSGTDTLAIGAGTFTVNGASTFTGNFGLATVTGTGGLILNGPTNASNVVFGGQLTVSNAGTFSETGHVTIGDGNGGLATLKNLAGGTYQLTTDDGVSFAGTSASSIVNNGMFAKTGGTGISTVTVGFSNQAGGTIGAGTGTILFAGALSNAGNIVGVGQLAISGAATLSAGTTLSVAQLDLSGTGALTLATSLSYGGILNDQSSGTNAINLGANTLTLTGTQNLAIGTFGSADIAGTGRLAVSTGAALTVAGVDLGGTAVLANAGTVKQTGIFTIGDSSGGAASITNAHGATWTMSNNTSILNGPAASASFNNSGVFTVTATTGVGSISTVFNNLAGGVINVASGSLQNNGVLTNGGTISGNDLSLTGSSQTTLTTGSKLLIGSLDLLGNASLNLSAGQSFAGTFNDTSNGSNTVNLGSNAFTLTGAVTFLGTFGSDFVTGSGKLTTSGATGLSGVVVGGTATFANTGTLLASGNLQIGDGSSNAAAFSNAAGGIYNIINDSAAIQHGTSLLSDFNNSGLFEKTSGAGTTVINTAFTNTGTITVTSGTLEFTSGSLNNTGVINGVVTTDGSGNVFITHH